MKKEELKSSLEVWMRKNLDTMNHKERIYVRILTALCFGLLCFLVSILLDKIVTHLKPIEYYLYPSLLAFSCWYMIFPLLIRSESINDKGNLRKFFKVIVFLSIISSYSLLLYLIWYYAHKQPLYLQKEMITIPLMAVILQLIIAIILTIGLLYVFNNKQIKNYQN